MQPGIEYEVALSFAGEQRGYVEDVARALQARGIAVFYDEFEKIALWGKQLPEELQAVYERKSGRVVIFVSKAWVEKAWPRHERRAVLSRAVQEPGEYVIPVRFDDTPVPGLPDGVYLFRCQRLLTSRARRNDSPEAWGQTLRGQGFRRTAPTNDLPCRRGCI